MAATSDATANAAAVLVDNHIAQSEGDRTALKYGTKNYAYHDLAALMNRAGNMLRNLGIEAGRHVLIAVAPSPACVASVLGAMKIGAIPVLTADADAKRLSKAIKELDPPVIVADAARVASLEKAAGERTIIVVGGESEPDRSFVDLLRASASSLTRGAVAGRSSAIAVLTSTGLSHATHEEIAKAKKPGAIKLPPHAGLDPGDMLATFAVGGSFSLPA
jgi:acyl-coenzyme A synthetase/AMP-(fatty) acid ligase